MVAGTARPTRPESTGGTEAADRVADVLVLFAQSDRPLGVSEIARSLSLSKAVVHRILQSLTSRSLLQLVQGDSTYVLGPAATSRHQGVEPDGRAHTRLTHPSEAARRTCETTTLSVLVGHQRIYLDQYESPQEVKMVVELGPRYPLHSGASSRSILAFLPRTFIDEAVRQLETAKPGVDTEGYLRELVEVRRKGYAVSRNERNIGAAAIAAPFFDAAGNVMGSVSSSGPDFRYGEEGHEDHVRW